jgi:hypothetical protein
MLSQANRFISQGGVVLSLTFNAIGIVDHLFQYLVGHDNNISMLIDNGRGEWDFCGHDA